MLSLLIAASLAQASMAPPPGVAEATHALAAGRVDQARIMIGAAIANGASGPAVERLLADLDFIGDNHAAALIRYESLFAGGSDDPMIAERAGISALRLGQLAKAEAFLARATASNTATWRAWNARGVAADFRRDWAAADAHYARAATLAPDRAEIANNQGWSLLIRGNWAEAVRPLERAAALDPKSPRIASNLELARAAIAERLPQRRSGESDESWAARLNDAGLIAQVRGDRRRAIAAFSQALSLRSEWFERAANNLAALEDRR